MHTRTSTFLNHKAIDNHGTGMWWDIDNTDITVENGYMDGNYCRGLFVEYSQGPSLIKNSTIINTRQSDIVNDHLEGGLNISVTRNVTITGCTIKNNVIGQVHVWYGARRSDNENYETGGPIQNGWDVSDIYLRNNDIEVVSAGQHVINIPNWDYLLSSWNSDYITYKHSWRNDAFYVYNPSTQTGTNYTFSGWKTLIRNASGVQAREANSTFNGSSARVAFDQAKSSESSQNISVFPNPAREQFTVRVPAGLQGAVTLSLVNTHSREVIRLGTTTLAGSETIPVQVSHLPAGMYLLHLSDGKKQITEKVVIGR